MYVVQLTYLYLNFEKVTTLTTVMFRDSGVLENKLFLVPI